MRIHVARIKMKYTLYRRTLGEIDMPCSLQVLVPGELEAEEYSLIMISLQMNSGDIGMETAIAVPLDTYFLS